MLFEMKGNYFDGNFHLPKKGRTSQEILKYSPANTDQLLWKCPVDSNHVSNVVSSARDGFKIWKTKNIAQRAEYLKRFQEEVTKVKEQMAKAISLETGKPLWEATTEVSAVIGKVNVTLADSLKRIQSQYIEKIMPGTRGFVRFKPLGPCLVIGPFNFPCHLANTQILSALLAGNSIIFKPSEKTIYSGQILTDCLDRAGFPKGVVNLINGGGDIASRLVKEPSIKGIFFTGSKEVGGKILDLTYKDFSKVVALEMGGKNTCIVHKDANLDLATTELIKAAFLTSGQRCVSTSKIAIHKSLIDNFVNNFHKITKRLVIDHPIEYDSEPFMGPLIDEKSAENYINYMGMAKREGAEEIMRGKLIEKKYPGYYVSPSIHIVKEVDPKKYFINSEIFGPNTSFIPYEDIDEAIHIANASEYGLAAGVFTEDRSLYKKCVDNIDVGLCNLNRSTAGASARLPFGGVKNSGNHHPAAVSMIDSCAYPISGLEIIGDSIDYSLDTIKGLAPS